MPISFNRPTLILSNNSTFVANIQVSRNDNLCFTVDQHANIRCTDLTVVIPTGPNSSPFQIVPGTCKPPPGKPAERVAELAMDPAAINDWHALFNDRRSIILPMLLSNNIAKELTIDLFCTQHSVVPMTSLHARHVARVKRAFNSFVQAVSRFLGKTKDDDHMEDAVHTEGR